MSTTTNTAPHPVLRGLRIWLGVAGALALITGLVIVFWPGRSAIAITFVLAFYAILAGLAYLVAAFTGGRSGWLRLGHALAGVLFIAAGVIAFMNPAESAASIAIVVVVFIGISWIFEGVASLAMLKWVASKGWTIFFAIISILGGIAVIMTPLFAASLLLLWVGITLILIGILGIARAITMRDH